MCYQHGWRCCQGCSAIHPPHRLHSALGELLHNFVMMSELMFSLMWLGWDGIGIEARIIVLGTWEAALYCSPTRKHRAIQPGQPILGHHKALPDIHVSIRNLSQSFDSFRCKLWCINGWKIYMTSKFMEFVYMYNQQTSLDSRGLVSPNSSRRAFPESNLQYRRLLRS